MTNSGELSVQLCCVLLLHYTCHLQGWHRQKTDRLSPQQREPRDEGGNRSLLLATPHQMCEGPACQLEQYGIYSWEKQMKPASHTSQVLFVPLSKCFAFYGFQKWHFKALLSP